MATERATSRAGPRWARRLVAFVAGAALTLVFPAAGLWWWAYVGLVPVLVVVRGSPARREALWCCWAAACGFFLGLHHWLVPVLSLFTVPVVLAVGLVWLPWGLAAWWLLHGTVTASRAAAAVVVLPSVWVLVELVRSWDRLGGSWGFLGLSQWQVRPILGVAALGGVWALSFLLVTTNVAVTVAFGRGTPRRVRIGAGLLALAVVAGAAGYGTWRPEPEVVGHLRVGGVQTGVVDDRRDRLAAHVRLTRDLIHAGGDVDVVVWGQSSVGFDLRVDDRARRQVLALAREADRPIVVNVDARGPEGGISKTAVVVRPDGLGETYVKQRLVPFGEYIPLRSLFGWVAGATEAAEEDRVPGTGLTAFDLAGTTVGPLISYESTFPDMRRTLARRGVDMTLVQAAATTFQDSWALPQQASFEAVRAVASGRPAVLVAMSGTSAAFDARGERLAWIDQDRTGTWTVDAPLARTDTPFVRWGAWLPVLSLAVVLGAVVVAVRRGLRARRTTPRASRAVRRGRTAGARRR